MKTFTPPYGILAILFLALSFLIVTPMKSQTIQIDSTFSTDAEIFPFENIELISELLIEGDVELSSDTNLVSQADSIITFLEEENDLASKYNLAFRYWNRLDSVEAFEILNTIPEQYNLTNDQLTTHQQYLDYFDILKLIADSNWTASDLDSVSVELLFEIKENGGSGISAFARGMLLKGGFIDYKETIVLPRLASPEENSFANKNIDDNEQRKDYLKLFPNPAGDYVIVFYDIGSDSRSFSLKLVDNQGIVIRIIQLEPGKDQIVVNLENLPNGIYLFTLNVNGKKLESQKLIKIRN